MNITKIINFFIFLMLFSSVSFASISVDNTELSVSMNPGETHEFVFNLSISSINKTTYISISDFLPEFERQLSPTSLIVSNDTKSYQIFYHVTSGVFLSPGTYEGYLQIDSDQDKNISIPVSITINEYENFVVLPVQNFNVTNGEIGEFYINLVNGGNQNLNVPVSVSTNLSQFEFANNFSIATGQNKKFYVQYIIPENQTPGNYTTIFSFGDKEVSFVIDVIDEILPEVEILNEELNVSVKKPFTIYVNASDNVAVERVIGELACSSGIYNRTFLKYGNEWRIDFDAIDRIDTCSLTVRAYDTSENIGLFSRNINTKYSEGFDTTDIDFLKMAINRTKEIEFFNTSEPMNVSISLVSFDFVPTHTILNMTTDKKLSFFDILLIPDNKEALKFDYVDEKKILNINSNFKLSVKGVEEGRFNGTLKIRVPSYVSAENEIFVGFSGYIANYTVAQAWSGELLGHKVVCHPDDHGTFEDSSYICNVYYPIDVDYRTINYPVTKDMQDKNTMYWENRINTLNEKIQDAESMKRLYIYIIVVMIIVLIFYNVITKWTSEHLILRKG